jgi:hypothetical protein
MAKVLHFTQDLTKGGSERPVGVHVSERVANSALFNEALLRLPLHMMGSIQDPSLSAVIWRSAKNHLSARWLIERRQS